MSLSAFIVDLPEGTKWLSPPHLEGIVSFDICQRLQQNKAVLTTADDPLRVRELLVGHVDRIASSDEEVWRTFPELRTEFCAVVERFGISQRSKLTIPLRMTAVGDRQVLSALSYLDSLFDAYPRVRLASAPEFVPPHSELASVAPQLFEDVRPATRSVAEGVVFLLSGLSLSGLKSSVLVSGLEYVSPAGLIEDTDFGALLTRADELSIGPGLRSRLSANFTGAFIASDQSEELRPYWWAMVNRILSCVTVLSTCAGMVSSEVRIGPQGWSNRFYEFENWRIPLRPRTWGAPITFDASSDLFRAFLAILGTTDRAKFLAAKEDDLLLALETAADARASEILPLQYVQVWMAVERLLSFKTETSAQLALALSALVDTPSRSAEYDTIKKAYDLR